MNFSYETQGAITYLVCELEPAEQLDTLTLGMLTNNHIAGLAPVLYTEMNGQRFLKYNISAKVTSDNFFSGNMSRQRALTAFSNILNAICSADEYMIDPNCFSIKPGHVFFNVSSCDAALLCIPVVTDSNINSDTAEYFKNILFSAKFDNTEDSSYVGQMINYINNESMFSVYGLRDMVADLVARPAQSPAPMAQVQNNAPYGSQFAVPPAAPAQSPNRVAAQAETTVLAKDAAPWGVPQPAPANISNNNFAPPAQNVPVQNSPMQGMPPHGIPAQKPPVQNIPPQNTMNVPQNNIPRQQKVPAPMNPPVKEPAPAPWQDGPGFAIPGQQPMTNAKPAQQPAPDKMADKQQGEKKMSFLGLLSHYSKENAELYKKQKEEAKQKKTATPAQPQKVQPVQGNMAIPGQPAQQNQPMGANVPPMGMNVPPQQAPIQPLPVQNSFNETTVLSPMMMGNETTVLSGPGVVIPNPTLVRIKTGERVSINKPIFRIGKEKSYVDYFIGDNTAISRSHANVITENGEYFIEDTNSTNHTFVNGELINSNVRIKITNGDKVRLANEEFVFSV